MQKFYTLFFFLLISLNTSASSDKQIGVNLFEPLSTFYNLGSHLSWYEDTTNQYSLSQIMTSNLTWQSNHQVVPNFGFTHSTYWFTVALNNHATTDSDWLLELGYALLDEVDVYVMADGHVVQSYSMGDYKPFWDRPLPHRNFIMPLNFPAQSNIQIYLKIRTSSAMQVPLILWQEREFFLEDQHRVFGLGLYYGLAMVMILYNLLVFSSVRDRSYLLYVAYVCFATLFQASLQGLNYQYLWPESPHWNSVSVIFLLSMGLAFLALFTNEFLPIKNYYPKLSNLFVLIAVICFFIAILGLFIPYSIAVIMQIIFGIPLCLGALIAGVLLWIKGVSIARYFTLSWVSFLLGGVTLGFNKMGLIPRNIFTENAVQVGLALVFILFSLALAEQINQLKIKQLTMRRQAQKATLENEQKSQFMAMMSHELRTPMNGVLGMLQLLKKTKLNAQQLIYINTIQNSGNLLLRIINDSLDFFKINAGKLEIENVTFVIREVIDDHVKSFLPLSQKTGVILQTEFSMKVPDKVLGDPLRLGQIINNLLANAFKFTEQGHITLKVRLVHDHSDRVRFEIQDTGIGLSQDQQNHVFEAFSQADSSTTRQYGGTGLGLSICKQLCGAMQGEIGVNSTLGQGSLFWVELPLISTLTSSQSLEEATNLSSDVNSELRILVAEDDSVNQMVIEGMLNHFGITPVICHNGQAAVDAYQSVENAFQIILMDCEMPQLDGYQATEKIREYEQNNQQQTAIIIALSAHTLDEHRHACKMAGMSDFLAKPIDLDALKSLLLRYQVNFYVG